MRDSRNHTSKSGYLPEYQTLILLVLVTSLCSCSGMRNRRAQKEMAANQQQSYSDTGSYRNPDNYDNQIQSKENESAKYGSESIYADMPDAAIDMDSMRDDLDFIANKIKSNAENNYLDNRNNSSITAPHESTTTNRDKIRWKQLSADNNNSKIANDQSQTLSANSAINEINTNGNNPIANKTDSAAIKPDSNYNNANSRNTPVTSYTLSEMIVMISAKLAQERVYSDNPLHYSLADAALLLIDPARRIDPDTLYDLDQSEKEIIAAYQDHFLNLYRNISTNFDPDSLVKDLHDLAESLKPQPSLEITSFRLCKSVLNYGNYTEFESTSFVRGRSHQMIAYVEVENFLSILGASGLYHTVLAEEFELYTDADGTLVYSEPSQAAPDDCRNIRRDFYLVRKITLPANLNVGLYQLKVRVVDGQSNAEAEAIIPIRIVAGLR